MISMIRLITWKEAPEAEIAAATAALQLAGAASQVSGERLSPALPGGWNSGDLVWRLTFRDEAALTAWETGPAWVEAQAALAPWTARHDWVRIDQGEAGTRRPNLQGGIYRTLFLKTESYASEADVGQWMREMLGLPRYIPEILNWRLSRVAASGGAQAWTHAWEQEFATVENIKREYVEHPYHWGYLDRWFDPEMPCRIISTELCHTFTPIESSLLAAS